MTTLVSVPVSPLCQRLIDEMEIRRLGRATQRNYIRDVGRFATFLGRSTDTATAEDVRRCQITNNVSCRSFSGSNIGLHALRSHNRTCPQCDRQPVPESRDARSAVKPVAARSRPHKSRCRPGGQGRRRTPSRCLPLRHHSPRTRPGTTASQSVNTTVR